MAEVGLALLSGTFPLLLKSITSREVLDFFRDKELGEGLLRKLKIALQSVNAALDDAEEKQVSDPAVKEWLDELKDAVYDAEDIFDEINTERNFDPAAKVRNLPSNTAVEEIEKNIKEVLEKLEDLANQKDKIGLTVVVEGKPSKRLPTTSLIDTSSIYGRQDDKETIIKLLDSDDATGSEMRVIAIVGMGGIGKTTLAQLVYNDPKVGKKFKHRAWVSVSPEFDVFKATKTILEAVTSQINNTEDLNLLQKTLSDRLGNEEFLLVLDDVWNESYAYWELLSNPFRSGTKTIVIVTTRNEGVASTMRTIATHRLKELSDVDCWSLFEKHAFHNHNSDANAGLNAKGREIMKKCKGLPLAAKTIGALLFSKRDANEWNKILKSELWDLPNDGRNILPALRLSYKYLPSHLKRCFAYCSIFPKDYAFDKDQLVLLWMAEGFLQEPRNKTMEEVGDEYFNELVSRSLFQQSSGDDSRFVMHDLVNDLARFVSGQLNVRLEDDYSHKLVSKTRRLSYLITKFDHLEDLGAKAKRLRTFIPSVSSSSDVSLTKKVLNDLFSKLTRLRVLSLSHHSSNMIELPKSIGKMKHLRYLDLSFSIIKELQDSICMLNNLQTLILSSCRSLRKFPQDMHKLFNLRHLDLSFTTFKKLPDFISKLCNLQTLKLSGCRNLDEFPEDMQKLANLRHLDLSFTTFVTLPDFICELCNLQTLKLSGCRKLAVFPEDMKKLADLRHLDLSLTTFRRLPSSICEFRNLQTLKLSCCRSLDEFPRDMQKLAHLCHLDLSFTTFKSLPDFICELCNLQMLKLSYCRNLTALPRDMKKLMNCHLDITNTRIKQERIQPGSREGLGSSTTFSINKQDSSLITELGKVTNLPGTLSILDLQNVEPPEDARNAKLKDKKYLEELVLEWNVDTDFSKSQRTVFDCLEPHTNLQSLTINYYAGESFPNWVGSNSFSNIVSLHLTDCKYCCNLPPLGLLPSLNKLFLSGLDGVGEVGPEFYGREFSPSFGALKVLRFEHMLKWEKWSTVDAKKQGVTFPLLAELYINDCPRLTGELPSHLPSLAKLVISKCPQLVASLPRVPAECQLELLRCNALLLNTLPAAMQKLVVKGFDALESISDRMIFSQSGLQYLGIGDCPSLQFLPTGGLPSTLKTLEIAFCEKLHLPNSNYLSLEKLLLTRSCDSLKSFQLQSFPKLCELKIHGCTNLESLTAPEHKPHLVIWQIEIRNCPNFVSFPKGGLCAANLTRFSIINCQSLRRLPNAMRELLPSLEYLCIENCPEVEPFPEWALPSNLISISNNGCDKLATNRTGQGWQKLLIHGESEDVESLPQDTREKVSTTNLVSSAILRDPNPKWYKLPVRVPLCFGDKLLCAGAPADGSESLRCVTTRTKLPSHQGFSIPSHKNASIQDDLYQKVIALGLRIELLRRLDWGMIKKPTFPLTIWAEISLNNLPSHKPDNTPLSTSRDNFAIQNTAMVQNKCNKNKTDSRRALTQAFHDGVQRGLVVLDYKGAV